VCIDPQLLSQSIIPPIRDESLCSSMDSISLSSAMASLNACSTMSVHTTIEVEHFMSLDKEEAYPLEHGSSIEDIAPYSEYVGITAIWGAGSN